MKNIKGRTGEADYGRLGMLCWEFVLYWATRNHWGFCSKECHKWRWEFWKELIGGSVKGKSERQGDQLEDLHGSSAKDMKN